MTTENTTEKAAESATDNLHEAQRRAKETYEKAKKSKVWATTKVAAEMGLYAGVAIGTACVIIGGAKALSNAVFGKSSS